MQDQHYQNAKRILWIILFANLFAAFIKIGVGIACKSQSVIADGIHSFADGSSNIIGLIGICLASKPKDARQEAIFIYLSLLYWHGLAFSLVCPPGLISLCRFL